MMNRRRQRHCLGAFWVVWAVALPAGGAGWPKGPGAVDVVRGQFARDHERICSFGSRFAGQPGAAATADFLEAELRAAGIARRWRQPVELVLPVTESCTLEINDAPAARIYPVWPNGANLSTTSQEGITARAVYIGTGELSELPVDELAGRIAVMEFNTQARWQYAAMYGAVAVIFLCPEQTTWTESNGKYTYVSVPLPRFYVDDPALAGRLRRERDLTLTLRSRVRWRRRTVPNVLGYIPGGDPAHRDVVVVLHCRYDACCVVPDLAFGAEQAINPAIALQLVRHFADRPPAYSMLVAFVGGDTFELGGSRRLMKTLTDTQKQLGLDVADDEADLATLRGYRQALTSGDLVGAVTGWGNRHLRNDHVIWQTKMQIVRLLDELRRLRASGTDADRDDGERPPRETVDERRASLSARRVRLLQLQQRLHHDELRDTDVQVLEELVPAILGRLDRMIADRAGRVERKRVDLSVMQATGLGRASEGDYARGILFCSLELSSHGRRFGTFAQSYMCEKLVQNQLLGYGRPLRRIANELGFPPEIRQCYLDDTTEGRRHWQSDLPFPVVNGIDAAVSAGCLGMMFATTQDMRRRVDTPLDTAKRVDADRLGPQITMLGALLDEALHRPIPVVGSRLPRNLHKWEGIAAIPTPGESQLDLGVPDAVIYARSYWGSRHLGVRGIGVRDMVVLKTDGEGKYAVDDILDERVRRAGLTPEVYLFDDQGRVIMAMDRFVSWHKSIITGHPRKKDLKHLRGEMFECVQIGLLGLNDPRFLEDLDKVVVVEAARGSEVRRGFWSVDEGVCSVCLPTEMDRWQLVFAKGDSSRRMLMLNASADAPEGEGYPLDWRQQSPVAFLSASDFAILNEHRIRRLEDTGVIDPYLRRQHQQGRSEVRKADRARAAGDGTRAWRHATAALTSQAQVYQKTRRSADDTIYAVLFLLVGLVPFCYFVERLVLGARTVYRQIGGFALLFAIMTLLVGTFHPAFRISLTPVTILLAFVILFLSTVVVAIVLGKFRTELVRLKKGTGTFSEARAGGDRAAASSADDFKRFDVLHRAMLVGIANMRRRKVRTALTLATLVLLAFVIMSFTSPRTHLHPLHYDLTGLERIPPDRSTVMIQRLSWDPMPAWTLDHLETAYRDEAQVAGHWWITRNDLKTQYPKTLKMTGKDERYALLHAVSCIEPIEARVVGLDRLIGRAAMDHFASSKDSVLISSKVAERIGAGPGDPVEMFGSAFTVSAVVGHRDMLSLTGLNGQTYAPVDYQRLALLDPDPDEVQRKIDALEEAETQADLTGAATAEKFRVLSPDQFAIIRASRAGELDATLRAVVLVPRNPARTMALADELAGQIHRPVYANADGRVVLCAAMEITSLTGLGNVVVPLFISALIIFNTMLNCVYERRREIGILMSVGLAPAHVGALFVAEAAAYGTIGVVGGYIIGQGLGTVASKYNLVPGISLNFSSSAVVYTQLAIMVVVLLSSIWPARVAAKIAAPGSESTWKLPTPHGDDLTVALPFTMHGRDAGPVLVYLHDWLAGHTETSLARFCSGAIEVFSDADTGGRGFVAQIWLAPFDLGIMQTVELEIRPGPDPTIHEVNISLRREAGPHSAWVRSNRHFLTELRRQFLLWRSLGPQQTDAYRRLCPT